MNSNNQPNLLQRILWWASGATRSVLVECPTEHKKFAAIGAAMLFIAALAATSSGFALHQSYHSYPIAIVGGMAWAILVFTVERLIQISIRKSEINTRRDYLIALPRLLMIVVVSFLITDPLLHKFFEKDIDYQLTHETELAGTEAQSITDARYGKEMSDLEATNRTLAAELSTLKAERDKKFEEWMAEGAGTGGTHIPGKGTFYAEKEAAYQKADREYQARKSKIDEEIERNETRIRQLKIRQDEEITNVVAAKADARGLLARNSALFTIIRHDLGAATFAILLMLAFVLIESAPLTIKLVSKRGPYDKRFDREEDEQIFAEERKLDERKEIIEHETQSRIEQAASLRELNKSFIEKIRKAILKNEWQALDAEEREIALTMRTYVKDRILNELPRKPTDPTWSNHRASRPTTANPASVLVHLSYPEESTFTINFNNAEGEVTGSDLLYALRGIDRSLMPREGDGQPLAEYRAVNSAGTEIELTKPLFAQLNGGRMVTLTVAGEKIGDDMKDIN